MARPFRNSPASPYHLWADTFAALDRIGLGGRHCVRCGLHHWFGQPQRWSAGRDGQRFIKREAPVHPILCPEAPKGLLEAHQAPVQGLLPLRAPPRLGREFMTILVPMADVPRMPGLNALGADGWHAFGVMPANSGYLVFLQRDLSTRG